MKLKQHGLCRTGTNYLRFLLQSNYDVDALVHRAGWIHGAYFAHEALKTPVPVVLSVKEPFAWLASMWRQLADDGGLKQLHRVVCATHSFGAFIRSPILLCVGKRRWPEYRYVNPVQLWNGMNHHWLSIARIEEPKIKLVVVRYEDLFWQPDKETSRIATELELKRTTLSFINTDLDTKGAGDSDDPFASIVKGRPKFDRHDWYRNHEYRKLFRRDDANFVTYNLDSATVKALRYEKLVEAMR